MQSFFELRSACQFDADRLKKMKETALSLLQTAEKQSYTQALVLFTSNDAEYGAVIQNALAADHAEEIALLDRLRSANDTAVRYVLCVWSDVCVDIPSHAFRTLLCDLDPQNSETLIFVKTKTEIAAVKLQNVLK